MDPSSDAAQLVANAEALILDFDGPVCRVFAGFPAVRIARSLHRQFEFEQFHSDPLWYVAHAPSRQTPVDAVHQALSEAECEAVASAVETPGVRDLLKQVGLPVAIASNNSDSSIHQWLAKAGLADSIAHVEGRAPMAMKPDPYTLLRAAEELRTDVRRCVFVGDSMTDASAAQSADIDFIGFANKPTKRQEFTRWGCTRIIDSMYELLPGPLDPSRAEASR